ncbi:sugar ABC transporter substrate-binding protein [Desulfofundulus sp.]|uniref:sugar ABC transporter substrate-binding protein n=1 Tax=Desulfofundulus sp. TaxID=2282750 RepID=UPI003C788D1D
MLRKPALLKTVLVLLVFVVSILASGCGNKAGNEKNSGSNNDNKQIRVALFELASANEWNQALLNGVKSKLDEYNASLQVFDCEFSVQKQYDQIQDAITTGKFDALLIQPQDTNAVVPLVKEAINKGIKVIAVDAPLGPNIRSLEPYPDGVSCVVGRTGWSTGNWLGKYAVKASEGMKVCKVAFLIGSQGQTIDRDRYEGFLNQIKDHPNIKVVAFQQANYDRATARNIMMNVFQAHPDINIVVSTGDQMTLGAEDAAKELGIKGVKYIGNGCSKQGYQALKEGRWYASYADIPYTEGQLCLENAVKAVRGEKIPRSINLEDMRPPLPPEGPMITPENAHEYKPQW